MKIKNQKSKIVLVLLSVLIFLGCKDNVDKPFLALETSEVIFSAEQGSKLVSVSSNSEISVTSSQSSWCSATVISDNGAKSIEITVQRNINATQGRAANITVSAGAATAAIEVKQDAATMPPFFNVVANSALQFTAQAAQQHFSVNANVSFTATSSAQSWCTVVINHNATSNNVTVSVTENNTYTDRTANIVIAASEFEDVVVKVVQSGKNTTAKVMSFNILYSGAAEHTGDFAWNARRTPCINMLREQMPDVIGFQEPRTDQINDLIAALPEYNHFAIGLTTSSTTMHNMIMYRNDKYVLLSSGHFWLSETPDVRSRGWDGAQNRMAQWVHLRENVTGKEFYFCNTHLDHVGAQARLNGATLIITKMKEIAGEDKPIFVVGDMNASYAAVDTRRDQLQPFYNWMQSARETAPDTQLEPLSFNDLDYSQHRATWNIDHIFYRNATALVYRVISSPNYGVTYISDHWPLTLVCEF